MNFYNPFKPHIVYDINRQTYHIRKWSILFLSWNYLDNDSEYWWTKPYLHNATFKSLDEAKERLKVYQPNMKRVIL
jgi:hypothetical protein